MNCLNQVVTDRYAAYHGDCVEVLKGIPDQSIGYSIFFPAVCQPLHIQQQPARHG